MNAALEFAGKLALPVFPVASGTDGSGRNAKQPLTPHGFKDASAEPSVIAAWEARYRGCAWAAEPGRADLAVVDLDRKPGGPDGVAAWEDVLDRLGLDAGSVATLTVATPSGGQHLWFRVPDGGSCASRANVLVSPAVMAAWRETRAAAMAAAQEAARAKGVDHATAREAVKRAAAAVAPPRSGVDVRGRLGYVLLPGSAIAAGGYVVIADEPIADMPQALLEALRAEEAPARPPARPWEQGFASPDLIRRALAAMDAGTAARARDGWRNVMFAVMAACDDPGEVRGDFLAWARTAGAETRDNERQWDSVGHVTMKGEALAGFVRAHGDGSPDAQAVAAQLDTARRNALGRMMLDLPRTYSIGRTLPSVVEGDGDDGDDGEAGEAQGGVLGDMEADPAAEALAEAAGELAGRVLSACRAAVLATRDEGLARAASAALGGEVERAARASAVKAAATQALAALDEVEPSELGGLAEAARRAWTQPNTGSFSWLHGGHGGVNVHPMRELADWLPRYGVRMWTADGRLGEALDALADAASLSLKGGEDGAAVSVRDAMLGKLRAAPGRAVGVWLRELRQAAAIAVEVDVFAGADVVSVAGGTAHVARRYEALKLPGDVPDALAEVVMTDYFGGPGVRADGADGRLPGGRDLIDMIAAARCAPDRRQAYAWLRAPASFGKGMLKGALAELGVVAEVSLDEVERAVEGGPSGLSAETLSRAWVLLIDEFKGVKREIKQLENRISFAPKHQPRTSVPVFAKLFLSAEDNVALTGTGAVEAQFLERFSYLPAGDGAQALDASPLKQRLGGETYRKALARGIGLRLTERVEGYRALGRTAGMRQAGADLAAFHERWGMRRAFADLDAGLDAQADDLLDFIAENRRLPGGGSPGWKIVTGAAFGEPRAVLTSPVMAFNQWLDRHGVDPSVRATLRPKRAAILALLAADGAGAGVHWQDGRTVKGIQLRPDLARRVAPAQWGPRLVATGPEDAPEPGPGGEAGE